jgi:hypothetical protein
MERPSGIRAHSLLQLRPALQRCTTDRGDAVPGLKPRPGGGTVRQHVADHGWNEEVERRHDVASSREAAGAERHAHLLSVGGDHDRIPRRLGDALRHFVPARDRRTVHAVDALARLQPRQLRRARGRAHPADHTRCHDGLAVPGVEHGEHDEGEDDVHHHAGDHDEQSRGEALGLEPPVLGNGPWSERHHRIRIVSLLARLEPPSLLAPALDERRLRIVPRGHPHVAAERKQREHVFRLAAALAEQGRTEADGKARRVDAGELRGDEVAELVHEDDEAEDDDRRDES